MPIHTKVFTNLIIVVSSGISKTLVNKNNKATKGKTKFLKIIMVAINGFSSWRSRTIISFKIIIIKGNPKINEIAQRNQFCSTNATGMIIN